MPLHPFVAEENFHCQIFTPRTLFHTPHLSFSLTRPHTDSIKHEDRAMTNAQALLQAAWLGDTVSVKRCLVCVCVYVCVCVCVTIHSYTFPYLPTQSHPPLFPPSSSSPFSHTHTPSSSHTHPPPSSHSHTQSGNHYLDVNCRNSDSMTPLLLVTRDISFFEKGDLLSVSSP